MFDAWIHAWSTFPARTVVLQGPLGLIGCVAKPATAPVGITSMNSDFKLSVPPATGGVNFQFPEGVTFAMEVRGHGLGALAVQDRVLEVSLLALLVWGGGCLVEEEEAEENGGFVMRLVTECCWWTFAGIGYC